MELIEYILEPVTTFGLVAYMLWRLFRKEIKDAWGDE